MVGPERDIARPDPFPCSESTAIEIDQEVKRLVMENYERAKRLISENLNALIALAKALLEKESSDNPGIELIIQHKTGPPQKSYLPYCTP